MNIIKLLIAIYFSCLPGCTTSGIGEEQSNKPIILEVDKAQVVIGETLFFRGQGLFNQNQGVTRLNFIGDFISETGEKYSVDITVTPLFDGEDEDSQLLRWSRVGPFAHPFIKGKDPEVGQFRGQVYPINVPNDGEATFGNAKSITLEILPSIAIEAWEPVIADCGEPALRGLGGLAYIMKVRAVGFEPTLFRYSLGETNGEELVFFEHEAKGKTDIIGGPDHILMLNDVPNEYGFYATSWSIEAEDAEGNVYENILPFTVHRPIDHYTDPKLREAEFMEPIPVSSCFRGAIGTNVVYSESTSETRQNSASFTLSRSWTSSQGQSETEQWRDSVSVSRSNAQSRSVSASLSETNTTGQTYGVTYNQSDSNQMNYGTSDGESWGWSLSNGDTVSRTDTGTYETSDTKSSAWQGEANTGVNLQVFSFGGGGSYGQTTTEGSRNSFSNSSGTQSRTDRGYSSQSSRNSSRSFGSTTTDSRGGSISGSYALSKAQTMTTSEGETMTISEGRTLELGGGMTRSSTITEGETEAYQKTFTQSNTSTTLTSYDGYVPRSRFGVFYRQTTRLIRSSYVRSYNLCGVSSVMGEIQFSEWTWAPDLALSDQCPPFPQSNLPPAQCVIEPCGVQ